LVDCGTAFGTLQPLQAVSDIVQIGFVQAHLVVIIFLTDFQLFKFLRRGMFSGILSEFSIVQSPISLEAMIFINFSVSSEQPKRCSQMLQVKVH
jgi:hypothetical protein